MRIAHQGMAAVDGPMTPSKSDPSQYAISIKYSNVIV